MDRCITWGQIQPWLDAAWWYLIIILGTIGLLWAIVLVRAWMGREHERTRDD